MLVRSETMPRGDDPKNCERMMAFTRVFQAKNTTHLPDAFRSAEERASAIRDLQGQLATEPSLEIKCWDRDCALRDECPHYLADLSVTHHIATGRSGGGCDLWDGPEDAE